MRTPTTDDALHREAVDLCTDISSLLLRHRGAVRPEDAYRAAMECVRVAGHILGARAASLPWEAAGGFREARISVLKVMIALDRTGAYCPFPPREIEPLQGRLHDLALALRAMGGATAA